MGKVEPRSDLYSLAATMHHLLTGRDPQLEPPFSFPKLRDLAPEVSTKCAGVVMQALEQDVKKRPVSAKEMLRALPVPPPQPSGKLGASGGFAGASSPSSTMATVVFDGAAADSARASSRGVASSGGAASRSGAPASTMPTIVLSEPVAEKIRGDESFQATAARMVGPQIKKAIELGNKARDLIERQVKSRLAARNAGAAPSGSSTAKTKELKPAARESSHAAYRGVTLESPPSSTAPRDDSRFEKNNFNGADISKAPAKLVARGDDTEFGIFGTRTVIGRSQDDSDNLDIDLKDLAHGAERVSRNHAEIIKRGTDYFIRDLGSLNGTYIASRGKLGRDQLYKLKDRDQVVLGGAILQFRRKGSGA
jgi:hypothetical protein